MKKLQGFLMLALISFGIHAKATTYYVSPAGDDSNPGTLSEPFATCEKLSSVLRAGDIAYVRGGTYRVNKSSSSSNLWTIQSLEGTSSNPITIMAYPGESPVLNLGNVSWTASGVFGLIVSNCSYVHIKGIRVTGLAQNSSGNATALWYISSCDNVTIENCEADHGMYGFQIKNTNNSLFLNCDAHHLQDPYTSPAYEGSNGFDVTGNNSSTNITFRGCRAWWVCDDGFDLFNATGFFTFENCWSFWNGYVPGTFNKAGNGWGFKLGPNATDQSNTYLRSVTHCTSFENRTGGFDQNSGRCIIHLYNNTSWKNGSTGFNFCSTIDQTIPFVLKNNVSFQDPTPICSTKAWVQSNNSWNTATPTASSFASLDTTGVSGPRQSDGDLPLLSFLHLSSTSNLIDKGINVSLSFLGSLPDLGAFEYGGTSSSNKPPVAVAGSAQLIILPISLTVLNGTGSSDGDGTITAYNWRQVSGPASALLLTPTLATTTATSLVKGVYKFELKVTDNKGASGKDTVTVTVGNAGNQSPVADAGAPQNIILPSSSTTLTGNSSTDADGTIKSYNWSEVTGPTTADIVDPGVANTKVTGLEEGVYQFELKVTDDAGAVAKDTIQVTVDSVAIASGKLIKVNVFGGENPYDNKEWNNWDVTPGGSSSTFNYDDGTMSPVSAELSHGRHVVENSPDFGGGMAPAEVLRYSSYTYRERTLTITGLARAQTYDLELYASENVYDNKATVFAVAEQSDTVSTYNNLKNKVVFNDLKPNEDGQLVVNISSPDWNTYNYLNGFVLKGNDTSSAALKTNQQSRAQVTGEDKLNTEGSSISLYPNPVVDNFTLEISNKYTGNMNIQIMNQAGAISRSYAQKKTQQTERINLSAKNLSPGVYFVRIQIANWTDTRRFVKM